MLKSKFIATAAPVFSVAEAKDFIAEMRREFADASHNVPTFAIGHGQSKTEHASDDGEPSGTAGRPALAVLRGSGLGDVAIVITRYFGGTLLGTGGLVRAYSDATKAVIEALPKAQKIATHTVMLAVPYNLFEQSRLLITAKRGYILDEDFAGDITLTVRFEQADLAPFQAALQELSNGQIQAEIVESDENAIMPLIES